MKEIEKVNDIEAVIKHLNTWKLKEYQWRSAEFMGNALRAGGSKLPYLLYPYDYHNKGILSKIGFKIGLHGTFQERFTCLGGR